MTLEPEQVGPDDARRAMAAGVTRDALVEALHVATLFNTYDRLADALGWEVPAPEVFRRTAKMLLTRGYD